jgi:hypothetical protein
MEIEDDVYTHDLYYERLLKLSPYLSSWEQQELLADALKKNRSLEYQDEYDPLAPYKALISGNWGERPSRSYFREHNHVRVLMAMAPYAPEPRAMAHLALGADDALVHTTTNYYPEDLIPILYLVDTSLRMDLIDRIVQALVAPRDIVNRKIPEILSLLFADTSPEDRERIAASLHSKVKKRPPEAREVLLLSLCMDHLPQSERRDALDLLKRWAEESAEVAETVRRWEVFDGSEEPIHSWLRTVGSEGVPSLASRSMPTKSAVLESLRQAAASEERKRRPTLIIDATKAWVQLPAEDAFSVLAQVLPRFAEGALSQFLWDLQAIAPVVLKVGGQELVEAVIEEVNRIMAWWNFVEDEVLSDTQTEIIG